jgi:hypothetical protein
MRPSSTNCPSARRTLFRATANSPDRAVSDGTKEPGGSLAIYRDPRAVAVGRSRDAQCVARRVGRAYSTPVVPNAHSSVAATK